MPCDIAVHEDLCTDDTESIPALVPYSRVHGGSTGISLTDRCRLYDKV